MDIQLKDKIIKMKMNEARIQKLLVDPEDEWLLDFYTWAIIQRKNTNYVGTYAGKKHGIENGNIHLYLHHAIMGRPFPGFMIDHINHNGMDNRRANLRIVDNRTNLQNRKKSNKSGWPGVYPEGNRFRVIFMKNRKRINLGSFENPEKAYLAYLAETI
ncbi:MAG: hypothetical protein KAS39_04420 [Actinomycetia bacterium]|nr:hypothetical protein [Actinomycetes bacterium]